MTFNEVRFCARSFPETVEEPHFHYASFRIRGKIFATAPPGGEYLYVFVSDEDREMALDAQPDFLENLVWGKRVVGLRVTLPGAKSEVVHKLLRQAWSRKAPKKLVALFNVLPV